MRILIPFLALILASCSQENKPFAVPLGTEGGWKLASNAPLAATPPEFMRPIGLKQAVEARYSGPIDVVANIYEFKAESSAFEAMQKWRAVKGEDQFYKRNLFVVLRSEHPNKEMLMDFSRALQKAF